MYGKMPIRTDILVLGPDIDTDQLIIDNNIKEIEYIIDNNKIDYRYRFLLNACEKNKISIVKHLLEKYRYKSFMISHAMGICARINNFKIFKLLILKKMTCSKVQLEYYYDYTNSEDIKSFINKYLTMIIFLRENSFYSIKYEMYLIGFKKYKFSNIIIF